VFCSVLRGYFVGLSLAAVVGGQHKVLCAWCYHLLGVT